MWRVGLGLALGLLVAQFAFGQTEVEDPPPLKLPDVVIYGRDILKVARSKGLEASYPSVPPVKESENKNSKEDLSSLGVEKERFGEGGPGWRDWMVGARAEYGSFSMASLGLRQGSKIGDFHYLASADYQRWGDWVPHSSQEQGELRGQLGYRHSDKVAASVGVQLYGKEYGYYGSPRIAADRGEFIWLEGREKAEVNLGRALSLEASAYERGARHRFTSPSGSGPRWPDSKQGELGLRTALISSLGAHTLTLAGGYLYHLLDLSGDEDTSGGILTTRLEADIAFPANVSLLLNLAYHHYEDREESRHRFYPSARLLYRFVDGLSIFASYQPTVLFHGSRELFHQNNHIYPIQSSTEDRHFDLRLGLNAQYMSKVKAQTYIGMEKRKPQPVWVGSGEAWEVWVVDQVDEASVKKGGLDLEFSPIEPLTVSTSFTYEDIEDETGTYGHFPYNAEEKAEASIRYRPIEGLEIGTNLSYQGRRFTAAQDELEPFALVGVQASKTLLEHLQLWVGADNLLNTSYEIWDGYPMPGRTFRGGLRVEW